MIKIFKSAMNPESKHHMASGLAVISLMCVLILAYLQFGSVKQSSLSIENIEQQIERLDNQDELIIKELTIRSNDISTLKEQLEKLYSRFENEQEYITINIEDILRKMDYKYIQYDIRLDEVDHSNCDSKIEELYRELEEIRKEVK